MFYISHTACWNCKVRTRWLPAYHSAVLMIAGASLRMAITVPSMLCFMSMVYLFIIFSSSFSKNQFVGVVSVFVFLNVSGFGFLSWFYFSKRSDKYVDYVYNLGDGVKTLWSHPIIQYMLGSRCALFVLNLSSALFVLLINKLDKMTLIGVGSLVALMIPVEHQGFLSCFMAVVSYLAGSAYFSESLEQRKKLLLSAKHCFAAFMLLGCIPIIHLRSSVMDVSLMKRESFWTELTRNGYFFGSFVVWWQNTGFFFIIVLALGWFVLNKKQKLLYGATLVPFIFGNFFLLQPCARLNIHFFYPTWILVSSVIFCMFLHKSPDFVKNEEVKGIITALSITLFITTTCSSLMGLIKMWGTETIVWTEADEQVVNFVTKNTPKKSIFISLEAPWEPISTLAGRRLFVHSPYRMWIYGFQWFVYRDELNKVREDPSTPTAATVNYALQHLRKETEHHINPEDWKLAFAYESYELYNKSVY